MVSGDGLSQTVIPAPNSNMHSSGDTWGSQQQGANTWGTSPASRPWEAASQPTSWQQPRPGEGGSWSPWGGATSPRAGGSGGGGGAGGGAGAGWRSPAGNDSWGSSQSNQWKT